MIGSAITFTFRDFIRGISIPRAIMVYLHEYSRARADSQDRKREPEEKNQWVRGYINRVHINRQDL